MQSKRSLAVFKGEEELAAPATTFSKDTTTNPEEQNKDKASTSAISKIASTPTDDDNDQQLIGYISSAGPCLSMGQLKITENATIEKRPPWSLELVHTKKRKQLVVIGFKGGLYYNCTDTLAPFNYTRGNKLSRSIAICTAICLKAKNISSNVVSNWVLPYLEAYNELKRADGHCLLYVALREPYPTGSLALEINKLSDPTSNSAVPVETHILSQEHVFTMKARFTSETLPDNVTYSSVMLWDK
jgi:hypothetical protein